MGARFSIRADLDGWSLQDIVVVMDLLMELLSWPGWDGPGAARWGNETTSAQNRVAKRHPMVAVLTVAGNLANRLQSHALNRR